MQFIKRNKTIKILLVVLAIAIIGLIYIFAFPYKASSRVEFDNLSFEANYENAEDFGFVDANQLSNTNKLVAENDDLELYLDETTSHFSVRDKKSGELIKSNPEKDPRKPGEEVNDRQKATIEYYYANQSGVSSSVNHNYNKSIYHSETPENSEGFRSFKVKEIENGFQIYYSIRDYDIDYLYFPLYLNPEDYEPILEDRAHPARRFLVLVYGDTVDRETGLYKASPYEGLTAIRRNQLYEIFYVDKVFGEYSRERAIQENAENGYFEQVVRFGFEIAIQVTLENKAFEIRVIDESIQEFSDSRLTRITLFPYLGTAIDFDPDTGEENKGYLVIPDGSGAIMEFNNGKTRATAYQKRLYGNDIAKLPLSMPEQQESILLPLYGMVKENIGYAAIITQGSGMASIGAHVSGVGTDSYNRIYTSFRYMESEGVVLGTGWNTHDVTVWTKTRTKADFVTKYVVLTEDDNNYVGVAKAYQEYLRAEKGMQRLDDTNTNKVTLELLGAYDTTKFFLGVPYKSMDSLTTFKQAEEIVNELVDLGVDNIDILYNGINKSGLNNGLENKVKISSKLGGKRGFRKMEENLSELGVEVYPLANVVTTSGYNRLFDHFKYGSRRINGEVAADYEYHIPTKLPYRETNIDYQGDHYATNPLYYQTFLNQRNKSYLFDNVNLYGIGSILTSNFSKNKEMFLDETMLVHEEILKNVEDQKVMLNSPFGFSFPYANQITDLPVDMTLFNILDYSVPLVQIVLSGMVDYTTSSINMPSERDTQYKFLKTLETGSNLKYTLSYESSIKLIESYHNKYLATEYVDWINDIVEQNKIINELKIHEGSIVDHERLAPNVFKTTYSNGVEVIVNYGITSANVEGLTIPSLDFVARGV